MKERFAPCVGRSAGSEMMVHVKIIDQGRIIGNFRISQFREFQPILDTLKKKYDGDRKGMNDDEDDP